MIAVAIFGLLTACGGPSAAERASAAASAKASAHAAEVKAAATARRAAQLEYLKLVKPGNDLTDSIPKKAPWSAMPGWCAKYVDSDDKLMRGLRAYQWPKSAEAEITAMVDAIATERAEFQVCAGANGTAAIANAWTAAANDQATTAKAQLVRLALGLPSTK